MAPRRRRAALLALMVSIVAGACGSTAPSGSGAPTVPPVEASIAAPTPLQSLTTQLSGAAAALRGALEPEGFRLELVNRAFRTSEPPELSAAPRAVFQIDVGDPNAGYVTVYEFPDAASAATAGAALGRHLGSGFGQTNYALDAQFWVSQVGGTIIFTWWSCERSDDPARTERAFNLVSSVGQPIPVAR
ncbi:MAG: hypothetical protein H0U86_08750 [Chloroflexi bacterium]|nr:hypothetical protein [Chloroflexota bacterium]